MKRICTALVILALPAALLTGCLNSGGTDEFTSSQSDDPSPLPIVTDEPAPSKPAAAKPAPTLAADVDYATFKCRVWLGFPEVQRENAAQDFIRALQAVDQSPAFARTFAMGITTNCKVGPSLRVAEVAGALATLDTADFPH